MPIVSVTALAYLLITKLTGLGRVARRLCRLKPCRLYCFDSRRTRPEHPLPFPKKSRRGNFKKYAKGFLVGARPPFGGQAARLRVTLFAGNGF